MREVAGAGEASERAAQAPAEAEEEGWDTVYLSACREEAARYPSPRDAPGWLRGELGRAGRPPFLLRGHSSPALLVVLPAAHPARPGGGRVGEEGGGRSGWPAAIVCPGGGYKTLAPHEGGPAARWLASLGVVALLLRYRLPPDHPWPAARDDLLAALDYACSAEAARWRIDPSRLSVLGFSAGAHLAAHGLSARLRAAVLVYPATADATGEAVRTTAAAAAEVARGSALPPVYLVSSTNDRVCGAEEHGDRVHAELCTLGVECHYQRQKLGAHGFGVVPRWTTPCAAWLLDKLRDSPQASAPAAQRHDTHV